MLAWQVDNKTVTIITYFEGLKGKARRQDSVPLTSIITSMRRGVKVLGYDALWTESEDLKKKKSYFEQIIFNNKCLEGKGWKKTGEDSSSKNKEYPCGGQKMILSLCTWDIWIKSRDVCSFFNEAMVVFTAPSKISKKDD